MRCHIAGPLALMLALLVSPGGTRVIARQRAGGRVTGTPGCTAPGGYQASMSFVFLKNAGLTDNDKVDFSKTKVVRLASERISSRRFKQVHHVAFTERSGKTFEVITVNTVSNQECAETSIDRAYLVANQLTTGL